MTTFLFKEFLSFFKKFVPHQPTFVISTWAWKPCYPKNNRISKKIRVRHDRIVITHITCITTITCMCFISSLLRQHLERSGMQLCIKTIEHGTYKIILARWVNKALE
jgi:hypothetical protein